MVERMFLEANRMVVGRERECWGKERMRDLERQRLVLG
jgi:hypothetical protein